MCKIDSEVGYLFAIFDEFRKTELAEVIVKRCHM